MIYDCPNCTAALMYNPSTGKMDCLSCGSSFDVKQFEEKKVKAEAAAAKEEETQAREAALQEDDDMMEN